MLFLVFLPIATVAELSAFILVPIVAPLCDKDGRLPLIFRWLETHDALGWEGPLTEPATRKTTEKFGRRIGLVHWLLRNKVYTLRYWLRARVNDGDLMVQKGTDVPARWGFSYWYGKVGKYWEFQPRVGFGAFHLKLRIGWKMKPYFSGAPLNKAAGIFSGVSIRSDDWDDYVAK